LGYYARARNMHRAAKEIVFRFGGKIPADRETLRSLPGFGPYTAAAVLSIVARKPYPVVDANVRRVMMRLQGIRGQADARHDRRILSTLETLISRRAPGRFNQALMELGALVCRSGNPLCLACPVQAFCTAFRSGTQETIPAPKKTSTTKVEAVVAVIREGDKVLIQKRPPTGLLAGLWEFPGGKRKPGETLRAALVREIGEELGVELAEVRPLITVKHAYTRFQVTLRAYDCRVRPEDMDCLREKTVKTPRRWVSVRALRHYPFPSGSFKIVQSLG
jgi:A/G-specific adenine glycosylase